MYGLKHEYMICTVADEEIYYKQCAALEKHIPGIKKLDELHDVDDSRIQLYQVNGEEVRVYNDRQLNAVYVASGIQLESYFEKKEAASA